MICLRFKKDFFILRKFCFGFCAFGFEAILDASCYLTSIVDKSNHGPVITPFSVQLQEFILATTFFHYYLLTYLCYLAKYKTRGTFVIIFLICSDLLNCLSSVGTIFITTESV